MRYIRICPGCHQLFDTGRRDRVTCSTRCRVRIHRSAAHQTKRQDYERQGLDEADVAELAALQLLCPAIYKRRNSSKWLAKVGRAGRKRAIPLWRAPLRQAYLKKR